MRVLFTNSSERTHFLLMAPLAWALRTAGHEVRVAVPPTQVADVTRAGLTAVPVGRDRGLWQAIGRVKGWFDTGGAGFPPPYDAAERARDELTWDHLHEGYRVQIIRWHKMTNVPMMAELVAFAQAWRPDLVIWEPTTYAGAIAARACGATHARLLIGADVYGIARAHYRRLAAERPPEQRADPLADWLGSYARKYGTPFAEDLVTGQFTIDQLPPSLAVRADLRYVPLRYTPYGGPAAIPRWLWDPPQRRRVVLTMGLTITDHDVGYPVQLQDLLDSLADLDIELVATIVEAERKRLDRIPGNARLVPYVPLQAVLPTCAAVIHHAGVGTLGTAALHAVPQLALPWDVDQPVLAERLAAQGAGLACHATKADGPGVREQLLRLLREPAFRQHAGALRTEMLSLPTPHQLVPRLEELTTTHRDGG